jgi:phosphatidylserine/phosphatidylglycerophosphate/cardiolipin synthase-like enzyme
VVRVVCLLISLCLVGCSNPAHPFPPQKSGVAQPVRLWQDANIFGLVKQLIASARVRVMVEMYELERADLLREMGEAVGRGVKVRVITDPTLTGNRQSTAVLDSLGVPERVYPVDDRRHQIDHVKLLIADGKPRSVA